MICSLGFYFLLAKHILVKSSMRWNHCWKINKTVGRTAQCGLIGKMWFFQKEFPGILLQRNPRQEWWCMPVILVLWGWGRRILKQKDDVSMQTVVRLSEIKTKTKTKQKRTMKGNCICSCVISTFHSLHRNTHCQHWPLRASGPVVLWQCSEELPWCPLLTPAMGCEWSCLFAGDSLSWAYVDEL